MKKDESAGKRDPRAERQKRLAEALRANLRRRKAAARMEKPVDADSRTAEKSGSPGNDKKGGD